MFAVIRSGGKQFRVVEGATISVDRLDAAVGSTVDLEVVAVSDGDAIALSSALGGATVTAEVLGERRGRKIDVLRYKSKVRYRKSMGFRPTYTDLKITKISAPAD